MTLPQHLVRWSLSAAALITVLFLNAWLEREHSETDSLQRSADISNDRAQEYAAINNPKE